MKIAFVTGSTKGIGRQIGIDLLKQGYYVYFNYANDDLEATHLAEELFLYEGNFSIIKANLSDSSGVLNIIFQLPKVDILVLNAGMTDRTPFGQVLISNWNKVFEMNLTVPFFLVQSLKDKISPNGKIIFISSISGIVPDSVSISYGVSKAAINMLVLYLAKEFANKKITVNAIAPGYTDTTWHSNKSKEQIKRIEKKCLANRLGTVQEVSKAVMSVIDNNFINGQILRCDGGFGL